MEVTNKQLERASQQILLKTVEEYAVTQKAISIPRRFYCEWTLPGDEIQYDKGKELVNDPENRCCFNHRVGLPTRKWETDNASTEVIPVPLTHFNFRMMNNYFNHKLYSQNKCRGSGASEILTIRYMIFKYGVMNTVYNKKCMVLPGTSSKLSIEFSTRIKAVCDRIPQIYQTIPKSIAPTKFIFKTGGRIELTSATVDADRGFENVGDIILEEVAHWDLHNDEGVYYAAQGVHDKTRCHVVHSTTPKNKTGFYFDFIWDKEANSSFDKHITNWREVVGLPVQTIEELQQIWIKEGDITPKRLHSLRQQCLHNYKNNSEYRYWYDNFPKIQDHGKSIPINELMDIPIPILDINAIIIESLTSRTHYDQELDNEFTSSDRMALGDFADADVEPDDLMAQLKEFNTNFGEYE